jgi:excisionase family DNA binding protein
VAAVTSPPPHAEDEQEWLTASEAAARLRWAANTVKKACDRGELAFQKTPGGHYRVLSADVERRRGLEAAAVTAQPDGGEAA